MCIRDSRIPGTYPLLAAAAAAQEEEEAAVAAAGGTATPLEVGLADVGR